MTDFEDVLARLDPDTKKSFRIASEIEKRTIPTASFGLNLLLGGGLPVGHQITLWGNESAGKSALMLQTVALNQKAGLTCAYIDAEGTFDKKWARRLGVDTDKLFISRKSNISEVTDQVVKSVHAGVDLIVVDSISQLMPQSFYTDGELKEFEKTRQVGQQAKDLGQMSRMIQGENFDSTIVYISQVRMDLGNSFMPGMKPTGGKETGHMDILRIRLFSSKSEKQAITEEVSYGDITLSEIVGRNVTWTIDKNKTNGKYGNGEYGLYTQGDYVGVDRVGEVLDLGIKYGLVKKAGAFFTIGENKTQGRAKTLAWLKENPEEASQLEKQISELYQSV